MGRHRHLIGRQKWWCENAQCHWVRFVMCLFDEGRRQGKRRSWWNDYIVAERGRGGSVLNSWQRASLFNTVLLYPVEAREIRSKKRCSSSFTSLVCSIPPQAPFQNKRKIWPYALCMSSLNFLHISTLFKIQTKLSWTLKTCVNWCKLRWVKRQIHPVA